MGSEMCIRDRGQPPSLILNRDPTPADQVFSNSELIKIVNKAATLRDHPIPATSLPSFVSMHKIFLVACAICLFHNEGICATISASRFLDDGQITLDNLKATTLCNDCLRRSKCCPFCQSLNREVSLEKRRENSLLLKAIHVMTNSETGKRYLSVTYPLTCNPQIAYHP